MASFESRSVAVKGQVKRGIALRGFNAGRARLQPGQYKLALKGRDFSPAVLLVQ